MSANYPDGNNVTESAGICTEQFIKNVNSARNSWPVQCISGNPKDVVSHWTRTSDELIMNNNRTPVAPFTNMV